MPHIQYPKRRFDPRPGRTSTVGPNSVGKVPITRMTVPSLKEEPDARKPRADSR